jgi:hypothetical protein
MVPMLFQCSDDNFHSSYSVEERKSFNWLIEYGKEIELWIIILNWLVANEFSTGLTPVE